MAAEPLTCYACSVAAAGRCRRCGRGFCKEHGDWLCAECAAPGSKLAPPLAVLPSPRFYRGVVATLFMAVVGSVLLLIARPGPWPIPPRATPMPLLEAGLAGEATATPQPSSPTATPSATRRHVVAQGDTLLALAIRYNTTVEKIADANELSDPYPLRIGQVLIIPSD